MANFKLSGGCHCGAVRYSLYGPASDTHHCHCGICRKLHGAIFVTLSTFPRDRFSIDKGSDNVATYNSSATVHRHFCKSCGCQLWLDADGAPDSVLIATGTLDGGADPGHPRNTLRHAFVASKPWYEIANHLLQES